jgi:hypothetical protein
VKNNSSFSNDIVGTWSNIIRQTAKATCRRRVKCFLMDKHIEGIKPICNDHLQMMEEERRENILKPNVKLALGEVN